MYYDLILKSSTQSNYWEEFKFSYKYEVIAELVTDLRNP